MNYENMTAEQIGQLIEGAHERAKLINTVQASLKHGPLSPKLEEKFQISCADQLNIIDECIEGLDVGTGDKAYLQTAKEIKKNLENQASNTNAPTRRKIMEREKHLAKQALQQTHSYLKKKDHREKRGMSFLATLGTDTTTVPWRAYRALKSVQNGAAAATMLLLTQQVVAGEILRKNLPYSLDEEKDKPEEHKTRVHVEWPANTSRRAENERIIREAVDMGLEMTQFSPTQTITIKVVGGDTGGSFEEGIIKLNKDLFKAGPLGNGLTDDEGKLRIIATIVHEIAHLCFAHMHPAAMQFHDKMEDVAHAQRAVENQDEASKMYGEYVNGYLRETEQYAYNIEQEFLSLQKDLMQKSGFFRRHHASTLAKLLAENKEMLDKVAKSEVRRWEHEKKEFYGLAFLTYIFADLQEKDQEDKRPLNVDVAKYQKEYEAPDEVVETAFKILIGERIVAPSQVNHKTKEVRIEQRSYNELTKFLLRTQQN